MTEQKYYYKSTTKKEFNCVKDEIVNDIRYDKTFERKLGKHCDFCDFYKLCYNTENNSDNLIAYYEEPKEKIDNKNSEELFK